MSAITAEQIDGLESYCKAQAEWVSLQVGFERGLKHFELMVEVIGAYRSVAAERDALRAEVERLRGELEKNDWRLVETSREIDRTEEIIAELDDSDTITREVMEINLASLQKREARLLEEIRGRREPAQHSEGISKPRGG